MRTYKLYFTQSATTNNVASIQFARSGVVSHLRWSAFFVAKTDGAAATAELSMQAVQQIGVNNTIGVIDEIRGNSNFVTSGLAMGQINVERSLAFPVNAGESFYINMLVSGTASLSGTVFIDVEE